MTNAPTTRETADHIGEANEKVADHIGDATTMIDHAELARRTMEQLNLMAAGKQTLFGSVAVAQMAVELNENLLSEIAALRGDLTETRVAADLLVSSLRADLRQAERQRDEAVGLLRRIDRTYADMQDGNGNHPTELRKVRAFLATQGAE